MAGDVPKYLQLIERSARLLKPGGLLVVTELEHFHVRFVSFSTSIISPEMLPFSTEFCDP